MVMAAVTMIVMIIMAVRGMRVIMMRAVNVLVMAEGFQQRSAEKPGNNGTDQRKENDCLVHNLNQPFIMLMSSTSMVLRLRK